MPDSQQQRPRRIVVAITGATGAVYGLRLLQLLVAIPGVETHLVLSDAAVLTLHQETGVGRKEIEAQAHVVHKLRDIGATYRQRLVSIGWHGCRAVLDEDAGGRGTWLVG